MKKRLLYVLALCVSLSVQWATAQISFAGGDGTAEDPWQISNAEQLNLLRNYLGDVHGDKYFILTTHIDLSTFLSEGNPGYNNGKGWESIGTYTNNFYGNLDGQGYTISGLWADRGVETDEEEYIALFGGIEEATLQHICIEIAAEGIKGYGYVGGLVGYAFKSSISGCSVVGQGIISGIAGVGGLAGYTSKSSVSQCFATVDIEILERKDRSSLLVAAFGGLIGKSGDDISLSDSYATGDISLANAGGEYTSQLLYLGGLTGSFSSDIMTRCYATGKVEASTSDPTKVLAGGLIGYNWTKEEDTITFSFFNVEVNGKGIGENHASNATVPGKTLAELQLADTYTDWADFSSTWYFPVTGGTPNLQVFLFAGGDGSEGDPFRICTAAQLAELNRYLGEAHNGKHFILAADIDMATYLSEGNPGYNEGKGWTPIGSEMYDNVFQATLDGRMKTIRGLWINEEYKKNYNDVALFGAIGYQGEISNLSVEIAERGIFGNSDAAGFAATNYGSITSCSVTGEVKADAYESVIGGLVGINYGSVTSCFMIGNVSAIGGNTNHLGGLVGANGGEITSCYAVASVKIEEDEEGKSGGSHYVGGLVGTNEGQITSCYAAGEVEIEGGEGMSLAGGLVGGNMGILSASYSIATVKASGEMALAGGLVGLTTIMAPVPTDCFYLKEAGHNEELFGLGLLVSGAGFVPCTSEYDGISPQDAVGMTTKATFAAWDFTPWTIRERKTAPYFPWQPEPYPELEVEEAFPSIYHTLTLSVGEGIVLYGLTAGEHTLAEGDHLYLQFLPEDISLTAEDILFRVDGVETAFNDFGAGHYYSYLLNPITADHTIEISLKENKPDPNPDTTGQMDLSFGQIHLTMDNGQLTIDNEMANAVDVAIYSVTGQNVVSLRALRGSKTFALPSGIYVVHAGKQTWKVMVND
ncbi:T9SS type A sorting domain-containing protein [Parabacteroides sp. PF5-6]|uniref:T9SS type A sorting domain-containing protein n=1 Tax=Parabacteroides sp. PF5-6 TaxID=1742403 RepID=UPI0024070318|nr:T9SS type A sorting domain-containing protein [Parabacteroides sp. PF5-6]MDF9831603.1 hypothetical protein [Parabacteroides sp. PF5-6]